MKFEIDVEGFDTLLQITDWRDAAACFGLVRFLKFHKLRFSYLTEADEQPIEAVRGFDGVLYNSEDITEERFLLFAENFFEDDMTHRTILKRLEPTEFDDEKIKEINELVKRKSVLQNVFKKTKFDGTNKDFFIKAIEDNRLTIIREIFRNGQNLYINYANKNLLLKPEQPHCRLAGYNVDEGRKTRFLGFCFSKDSFVGNDIPEYDFIPFAFSQPEMYETYFINNNFSMQALVETNEWLSGELKKKDENDKKKDSRGKLLTVLKNAGKFIDYDVEIITKSRDDDFYKTLFVHSERLKLLQEIPDKALDFTYKLGENNWLNLEREVYERCLNNVCLDDLILLMLKLYFASDISSGLTQARAFKLIDINQSWKGNTIMNEIESAKKMGFTVSQELIRQKKNNKINSYKQKLIGALTAHDYDRVKEILLSISAYVGMEFPFFYAFLEDAEENKDIAMAFTSALIDKTKDNKEN